MVVITGVSGSGKSSLAFDTIFQEGQRRYVESLSSYARQFIGSMKRPEVESVRGISPTISIDQKTINRNPRSTVGTVVEIMDHYRLLYARLGVPHCPKCHDVIRAQTPEQIVDSLLVNAVGKQVTVLAPIVQERKGEYRKELRELQEAGFVRARIDGILYRLGEEPVLARYEKHTIEVVIDRIRVEDKEISRLREAVEQALKKTGNLLAFLVEDEYQLVGTALACPKCQISIPELEPRLFSFNDPQGQCPRCKGLGRHYEFELDLLIPDDSLSLRQGVIGAQVAAGGHIMFTKHGYAEFTAIGKAYGFTLDTPWREMSAEARKAVLWGTKESLHWKAAREGWHGPKIVEKVEPVPGIIPVLQNLWDQWQIPMLRRFMHEELCGDCKGSRLNGVARAVLFHGKSIDQLAFWSVEDSTKFFLELSLNEKEQRIGREIFKEIRSRLGFLDQVGLGYLTLDRGAATLSGGEAQRIRLASQVGAGLQGVLYVLDEPSIGLHPRDNAKLLGILDRLRAQGNSLIVVEHDEDTMRHADLVVDIGPAAGVHGGLVIAKGHWTELLNDPQSITGQYLGGQKKIEVPEQRRPIGSAWIEVLGASHNNLKNVDVRFPIGVFTVVTGVSGSGKSTLVNQVLRKALAMEFHGSEEEPGKHRAIQGLEHLDKVIEIDQSPIGRTPRSNPATYTKIFDDIRDLFSSLPESKIRGYGKGRFSFNVAGGRCDECEGAGVKIVEMQILPNVEVPCEACNGKRFNDATLEIHYRGRTIADVLAMTIDDALVFFADHPKLRRPLEVLVELGLGYLQLGQPSTTLSGGEAQRMKISTELRRPGTGRTLYLLDEPTTGLHFEDIRRLLECLQRLVEKGNTLIVIEHNLDVVKCADWIVDMGPEAGVGGGEVVAEGTPEQIAKVKESHTGRFLKPLLRKQHSQLLAAESKALYKLNPPKKKESSSSDLDIVVQGARKHNLKNFTVRIPRHQMTVVTGLSGSGKSSLAFHTLFAEGQRRFVESLSTYARRFLGKVDRGMVDSIQGLAPAIAIDQGSASRSPRSTVATMTEIYDYFRILWARIGQPHCVHCGKATCKHSIADVAGQVSKLKGMTHVLFPLYLEGVERDVMAKEASQVEGLADRLKELGFRRLWVDGQWIDLEQPKWPRKIQEAWVLVDRVQSSKANQGRVVEAIEKCYEEGAGLLGLIPESAKAPIVYSQVPGCADCRWFLTHEPDPKNFSFNSHWGACSECQGLGVIGGSVCPSCEGERLRKEFRLVKVGGEGVSRISSLNIGNAFQWFSDLNLQKLGKSHFAVAQPLLREIQGRLEFLKGVGLAYLGLDRSGETLSGGEAQRIRLASQIGSGLEGVLYVLDEPTVGLHQRDTRQLLGTLARLKDLGNTLVVVEHDLEFIRAADHLLDMGPGAGDRGGSVVAEGTPKELSKKAALQKFPLSPTVPYLTNHICLEARHVQRDTSPAKEWIELQNIRCHNLKGVHAKFPVGRISAVSGVSGSGKSSLVMEALLPLTANALKPRSRRNLALGSIALPESIIEVQLVDQDPLGGTPRSTPASYTGVLDSLRKLYASLPQSKMKGFDVGRFSYNKAEGRCAACEGRGYLQIEMHFLSDVWELCEVCKGRRYNAETLTVEFKGKSIADVMDMRVQEAVEFFADHKQIVRPLRLLQSVGLGYLRLGQSATTLSGGEAQRLKLASELTRRSPKGSGVLYLLDEPTTGLHLQDIQALWGVMEELAAQGNTVVLVEHHPEVLRLADWIVDLGPEGGDQGGEVLFQGTVEAFLKGKAPNATRDALLSY